jgi:hypothetical protein
MPITHAFVSGISDSGDATLVQPSAWNDEHVDAWRVELRASGGDDAAAFRDAVAAAEPGTTFFLPDPLYLFSTADANDICVDIDTDHVSFVGIGPAAFSIGEPDQTGLSTVIKAVGLSADTTMFRWRPKVWDATAPGQQTVGGGLRNLSLYGNDNADVLLEIGGGCVQQEFIDLYCSGTAKHGLIMGRGNTTVGTVYGWNSAHHQYFRRVEFHSWAADDVIILDGNHDAAGGENTYGVMFLQCAVIHAGVGVHLYGCDDVAFINCGFGSSEPTVDYSFVVEGSSPTSNQIADSVLQIGSWGNTASHQLYKSATDTLPGFAKGHLGLGVSMTDAEARPVWEPGSLYHYIDNYGRHNLQFDQRMGARWQDDFIGPVSGAIGELGWTLETVGSSGVADITSTASHPGILRLTTGTASGDTASLSWLHGTVNNGGWFLTGGQFASYFVFRLPQTDSNTIARVGFSQNRTGTPSSGIYLEKLTGDTSWFAVCRSADVSSRSTALSAVVADTWVGLRIDRLRSDAVAFAIDDRLQVANQKVLTTNIPTTQPLFPFFYIETATTAAKSLDLDSWSLDLQGLVR